MQLAQLVLAVVSATRTFVPAAAPAVPAAMPALPVSAEQLALQRMAAPQPQARPSSWFGVEPVAAFAVAGVAAAAAVSVVNRAPRVRMQSDAAPPPAMPPASRTPEQMKAYSAAKAVAAVGGGGPAPNTTGLSTGGGQETGGGVWDPLGLSTLGSETTLAFFRHAEIKHGRVAMAAMVGFLVHINHIHFPGEIGQGVTFESLSQMGPFEAWSGIPMLGQAQILFAIGGIEHNSEWRCKDAGSGHYMAGGKPGDLTFLKSFWDPVGFTKGLSAEERARKLDAELKNGRLAMIGIIGCVAATTIPGSVPLLANAPLLTGPGLVLPLLSTAPMA